MAHDDSQPRTRDGTKMMMRSRNLDLVIIKVKVANNIEVSHQEHNKKGRVECEFFSGQEFEAAESQFKWDNCKKNPGHENFISAQDVINNYLPNLREEKQRNELRAWIDLTVRLRVHRTSANRPDGYDFADQRGTDHLRTGTGFIGSVTGPVYDKPCFCSECGGEVIRKHWLFSVCTAHHVVYNIEEAKETKVDLFYDDENCQQDGRMKSVWAYGLNRCVPYRDFCDILCATHDEVLGQKMASIWQKWYEREQEYLPTELAEINLIPTGNTLIVSHPHGQAKKITWGRTLIRNKEDANGSIHRFTYNACTCPGSSGAKVFVFSSHFSRHPNEVGIPGLFRLGISVHSGTFSEDIASSKEQINYGHN